MCLLSHTESYSNGLGLAPEQTKGCPCDPGHAKALLSSGDEKQIRVELCCSTKVFTYEHLVSKAEVWVHC